MMLSYKGGTIFMFTKELQELLEKYQERCPKQINDISYHINKIRELLVDIKNNIADDFPKLIRNNQSVDELCDDIKNFSVNIDEFSKISFVDENIKTKIEFQQLEFKFYKDTKLYLCADNICPICGCNMEEKETHFKYRENDRSNRVISDNIDSYFCSCCHKYFVSKDEIDKIDVSNTNITLYKDYYKEIPEVDVYTVIVLNSTLKCSSSHNSKDVIIKVPIINKLGELSYCNVNASYCFACRRFTILKEDFNNIDDVILCEVIDETYKSNISERDDLDFVQRKSKLFNYGYNVQTKKNLSEKQRQIILSTIMEANIMTKREIIDHISTLISRGDNIPSWKMATQKWKQDKQFVMDYQPEDMPEIIVNEVILKYKK